MSTSLSQNEATQLDARQAATFHDAICIVPFNQDFIKGRNMRMFQDIRISWTRKAYSARGSRVYYQLVPAAAPFCKKNICADITGACKSALDA